MWNTVEQTGTTDGHMYLGISANRSGRAPTARARLEIPILIRGESGSAGRWMYVDIEKGRGTVLATIGARPDPEIGRCHAVRAPQHDARRMASGARSVRGDTLRLIRPLLRVAEGGVLFCVAWRMPAT